MTAAVAVDMAATHAEDAKRIVPHLAGRLRKPTRHVAEVKKKRLAAARLFRRECTSLHHKAASMKVDGEGLNSEASP